jgi:hypothetical protein
MYDYFLGGYHNFAVDRDAAKQVLLAEPDFADFVRANRAFLRRAVSFLVRQGVCQFVDLGSGIPTAGNVHEVAHKLNPAVGVVYVDSDPIAVSLSQEILAGNPRAIAIDGDVRRPEELLARADLKRIIDFHQPVAVLLVALLHFLADDDEALRILSYLREALAPGSYIAITHATGIFNPERAAQTASVYNRATSPVTLRTREQVERFFDGFELVEPGLVPTPAWRPDSAEDVFANEPERGQAFAGVARKPRPKEV